MLGLYLSAFMEVLQDILGTIFSLLLEPQIIIVFDVILGFFVPLLKTIFAGILYAVLATILGILDFLQHIFNVLAGASTITYVGSGADNGKSFYMLEYLVTSDVITKVVLMCTMFSVAMSFLFAMYAIIKSISNSVVNEREFRPVAKILRSWFRGVLNFMMAPLLVIMGVKISILVLNQTNFAITRTMGGNSTTMGSIIFLANGMGAAAKGGGSKSYSSAGKRAATAAYGENKIPSTSDYINNPSVYDSLRVDYYIGEKDYKNVSQVQSDFDLSEYNFTSAFICALFVFYVLGTSLLLFIRIMMEVLVLYVASPFTISMFPIDDGRMFDEWKGSFFSRMVSGYGMVFSMSLFLTVVPTIMSPKMKFFYEMPAGQTFGYGGIFDSLLANKMAQNDANLSNVAYVVGLSELDYIMKTLFILGGAYSVMTAQHIILDIVAPSNAPGYRGTTSQGVSMINGFAKGKFMAMKNAIGGKDKDKDKGEKGEKGEKDGKEGDQSFKGGKNPQEQNNNEAHQRQMIMQQQQRQQNQPK